MAHHSQRLGFSRLADHLADCGKVEPDVAQGLCEASRAGGQPLPQALVEEGLLSDWDLAREVCEVFHLAFVPVDVAKPDTELLSLFEPGFLLEHGLVPLARFGDLVTMIMPGIVEADTLGSLAALSDLTIQPVVGTVQGNKAWLAKHLTPKNEGAPGEWGSLFDEGDAAVKAALGPDQESSAEEPLSLLPNKTEPSQGPSMARLLGDEHLDLPPAPHFEEQKRESQ
ncbi:MAG: hypothetical protein OSB42_04350 [Planctomycetota bacterium]|nr:hypothetical protein [Planctomycetota bacterium]